ncbi:MAG: bifunctional nuclease domain-containing protein [Chloroflexota bacterium]
MEKVQLVVLGLSASPASNNAYALILKELDGDRRLPIIIGAFEAQAIALEMEGVVPPRPMTHDLIKAMIDSFGAALSEVYINNLQDGTFYAQLIFDSLGVELDSRPSDAIAIAVRCNAPIFVSAEILEETGIMPQGEELEAAAEEQEEEFPFSKSPEAAAPIQQSSAPRTKLEELQEALDKAIREENYETAAKLRDQIKSYLENS